MPYKIYSSNKTLLCCEWRKWEFVTDILIKLALIAVKEFSLIVQCHLNFAFYNSILQKGKKAYTYNVLKTQIGLQLISMVHVFLFITLMCSTISKPKSLSVSVVYCAHTSLADKMVSNNFIWDITILNCNLTGATRIELQINLCRISRVESNPQSVLSLRTYYYFQSAARNTE